MAFSNWWKVGCILVASACVTEAGIAGEPEKAGSACSGWGSMASMFVEPQLICSHGIWTEASTLHQYGVAISVRTPGGELESGFPIVSMSGVPGEHSVYTREGNVVTGDAAGLTVTDTKDGERVRVEGEVQYRSKDGSWSRAVDVTVPLGDAVVVATRPDGATYTIQIKQL